MRLRLDDLPSWLDELAAFLAERHNAARAIDVLRLVGQCWPPVSLRDLIVSVTERSRRAGPALAQFLTETGRLAPPPSLVDGARLRRDRRIAATPAPWQTAARSFGNDELAERERARRLGLHVVSERTVEGRLAVIRDLALFCETRDIDDWRSITVADIEAFLSPVQRTRGQQLAALHRFFSWMRRNRRVFADPTQGLTANTNPRFKPRALSIAARRDLFTKWTDSQTDAHAAFAGLAAMLYGASKLELRALTVGCIDCAAQTIQFNDQAPAIAVDPWTWEALCRCLDIRAQRAPNNPHVIVAANRRASATPVGAGYLDRHLASNQPTTLRQLRASHLASTAERVDPMVLARAHGITTKAVLYYFADHDPDAPETGERQHRQGGLAEPSGTKRRAQEPRT